MNMEMMRLSDLEVLNVAIHFESSDPKIGRFWIGPKSKQAGKRDPYFTTTEIRDWWVDGARPDSFVAVIPIKRAFPAAEVVFCQDQTLSSPKKPAPPTVKDPVKEVLAGRQDIKVE